MLRRFFAIPLWQRTAAGFALGIIAGLILREQATVWLQPIGDVYLNLIRMVVAPLVLFTIASSIAKLGEGVGAVRLGCERSSGSPSPPCWPCWWVSRSATSSIRASACPTCRWAR
nr:cation:dicarboxylase symporter family transporter [Brevundimonas diminuta]